MSDGPEALPIMNRPILRMDGILCAGDLHIGIEADYSERGVHIPSQTFRMEREILESRGDEDTLVLLGDIKHMIPRSSRQERSEVPQFLMRMTDAFHRVIITRGNHDGGIEEFLPECDVEVVSSTGFRIGGIGFIHGHTWPSRRVMSSRLLVMAHAHPVIMFKDRLGRTTTEPCWLRCPLNGPDRRYPEIPDELVVVPPLNRSMGGFPVNLKGKKPLGPLLKSGLVDLDSCGVYLLDAIFLGRLGSLWVQRSK